MARSTMKSIFEHAFILFGFVALIACAETEFEGGALSSKGKKSEEKDEPTLEPEKEDEAGDSANDNSNEGDSGIDGVIDDTTDFTSLDVEPKDGLDMNEDEVELYRQPLQIEFHRFGDNAAWVNCVRLKVNNEPEVEVGCNKDPTNRVTTLNVLRKPHCNVLSIRLYSNGNFNFSTENPLSVRVETNGLENLAFFKGVKLFRESPNVLLGLVNDNGDDRDHSDTTFRLVGLEAINFRIENTSETCN